MKRIFKWSAILCLLGCQQQDNDNCGKESALAKVQQIPEVKNAIDKYRKTNQHIVFQLDDGIYKKRKYYIIKEEQESEFHNSVWNIFYVDSKTCLLYYYDTANGGLLSLDQWRLGSKLHRRKAKDEVKFTDLFNEGKDVRFTPNDLSSNKGNIRQFRSKLELYDSQHPSAYHFNTVLQETGSR